MTPWSSGLPHILQSRRLKQATTAYLKDIGGYPGGDVIGAVLSPNPVRGSAFCLHGGQRVRVAAGFVQPIVTACHHDSAALAPSWTRWMVHRGRLDDETWASQQTTSRLARSRLPKRDINCNRRWA